MTKSKEEKNNHKLIIVFSYLTILISFLLIGNELYKEYKINDKNEDKLVEFFEIQEQESIEEEIVEQPKEEIKKDSYKEPYLGVLEIKKIDLIRGFYNKNSRLNNVNRNIQLLNDSDMPNIENGNLLLAAHCGNSSVSFFRNLPKLNIGDQATVYYEGKTYNYKLVKNYEINKTGIASIIRNKSKNTLTLITCKHNTKKQLVFIFELEDIE